MTSISKSSCDCWDIWDFEMSKDEIRVELNNRFWGGRGAMWDDAVESFWAMPRPGRWQVVWTNNHLNHNSSHTLSQSPSTLNCNIVLPFTSMTKDADFLLKVSRYIDIQPLCTDIETGFDRVFKSQRGGDPRFTKELILLVASGRLRLYRIRAELAKQGVDRTTELLNDRRQEWEKEQAEYKQAQLAYEFWQQKLAPDQPSEPASSSMFESGSMSPRLSPTYYYLHSGLRNSCIYQHFAKQSR